MNKLIILSFIFIGFAGTLMIANDIMIQEEEDITIDRENEIFFDKDGIIVRGDKERYYEDYIQYKLKGGRE